jgi:hypothetical protein
VPILYQTAHQRPTDRSARTGNQDSHRDIFDHSWHHVECRRSALKISGVGRRDVGLGHRESRTDLALEQQQEPFALLLLAAIVDQDFDIASIRRIAVENLGCPSQSSHDFSQRRVFVITEAGAIPAGKKEISQSARSCRFFELFEQWRRLPVAEIIGLTVGMAEELSFVWIDVLFHESQEFFLKHLGPFAEGKRWSASVRVRELIVASYEIG